MYDKLPFRPPRRARTSFSCVFGCRQRTPAPPKDLIINKHLRVNRNRLTGGNFFSNVFSKGRHILGKIHGAVSKAHGHVANAINHGQTAIELANAALPVAAKYNNSLGSFLERRKE